MKNPPYSITEAGYAGFMVKVEVHMHNKTGTRKIALDYDLILPDYDRSELCHRVSYFLTFNDPSEEFLGNIIRAGGSLSADD